MLIFNELIKNLFYRNKKKKLLIHAHMKLYKQNSVDNLTWLSTFLIKFNNFKFKFQVKSYIYQTIRYGA